MERLKKVASLVVLITLISFCTSVFVFHYMREEALEKMLAIQEVMVIQSLLSNTNAAKNLVNARFQEVEENLYSSLGINMTFLKQIYDKRGKLPDQTVAAMIHNISKYRQSSELSRDERLKYVFKQDILDFMSRIEKGNAIRP